MFEREWFVEGDRVDEEEDQAQERRNAQRREKHTDGSIDGGCGSPVCEQPRGKDERPVASAEWDSTLNSWWPVSYQAMGRWMLEEAAANEFVRVAPIVSRRRKSGTRRRRPT